MDGDHERSLIAWANTFAEAAPAASLADFASGDALIPIARTIVRKENDHDDDDSDTATGWAGVFSHMRSAGLIEAGDEVPGDDNEEQKLATAVTCLEDLLRHTVGEHCVGRETFIRQIMSLDGDVQTCLRHIIVGEQPQQQSDSGSSEAGSPSRRQDDDDDAMSSFAAGTGSPAASAAVSSPLATGHLASSGGGSSYEEDDSNSSHSGEDDLGIKSWYSPHPHGSARRKSHVTGERAAPVGPKTKTRPGRTLDMDMEMVDMEEAETALVGETAASAESESFPRAMVADAADGAAGWTATAMEVGVSEAGFMPRPQQQQ